MSDIADMVANNLDIWTGAIERKSSAGRGGGKRIRLYGIERLRGLILDLAVRGKLVLQEPSDEPAGVLLKKIVQSRAELVRNATIKKPREFDGITKLDSPFPVPESWCWVRLDQIGAIVGGGTPSSNDAAYFADSGTGIAWLTPADLGGFTGRYIGHGARDLTRLGLNSSSATLMPAGTVLFTSRAPIGYVAIAECSLATNQGFKSIVPYISDCSLFVATALKAFAKAINDSAPGTTFKEVSGKIVAALPFPLPPLAEQHRIVAKVDELMALCSALERESTDALIAHQTLVETVLATLVNSSNAADLAANWERLERHFDILFTTEASIDALKQTILDLAVRGKLVKQDADDDSAQSMLAAAKQAFSKGKSAKSHPPIKLTDQPFALPDNWHWERFDNLIQPEVPIAYGVLVPGDDQPDGVPFVRIADLSITDPPALPEKAISRAVDAQYQRTTIKGGEILMGVVGSIGKLGVAPDSWAGANIARAICRIVPAPYMDRNYVLWLLQSRFMQDSFKGDTRTLAQPTLNLTLIRLAATPVPPLAEQHRIVAKVDELMVLCDTLKAGLAAATKTRRNLADAITEKAAA